MNYSLTLLALLGAAIILVPLFRWLKLGAVLGSIVAGVLIGPYALGWVTDAPTLLHIAELGITLLMFLVGLELEPKRLFALRREVFGLGAGQVLSCILFFGAVAFALGVPWQGAALIGAAVAMSSTAFIMPMLAEKQDAQALYGREAIAVCIFQDLAVIPMIVVLSVFASGGEGKAAPGWAALVALIAIALAGRWLLEKLFQLVARFGSQDTFTAAALGSTVAISLGLEAVGLSASLGAFIAGVLLADSSFKLRLEASIAPFEGLLLGLFFMAVGMGMNLPLLLSQPLLAVGLGLAIVAGKIGLMYGVRRVLARQLGQADCNQKNALQLAFTLAVGGEFAFVLLAAGHSASLISAQIADLLSLAVVISMVLAPIALLWLSRRLSQPSLETKAFDTPELEAPQVIIAGYGRMGQIIGRMLNAQNKAFTALDKNVEHVDFVRRFGNKIYYGDAGDLGLLAAAKVENAKLFVLVVDDVDESVHIAKQVLQHYPQLPILARARNRNHLLQLRALGITDIVRETWHSSLVMGEQTLSKIGLPQQTIADFLPRFVAHDQELLAKQAAVEQDNWEQLIALTQKANVELEHILQADAASPTTASAGK